MLNKPKSLTLITVVLARLRFLSILVGVVRARHMLSLERENLRYDCFLK